MKTLLKSLAILTVLAFCFAPSLARAQDDSGDDGQDVSFQTFYDQLSGQGSWVQTDDYGYVFQPNVDDSDWEPYTDGSWVDSDAGLTWDSDEPWGWATYHYGRWANIDGLGWVWVPGYEWAPAWVSWRYGDGYCGWAPLPPETLYGAEYGEPGTDVGFGFHFGGDVDVSFNIGPGCYNFIRIEDMGERNYRHHFVNRNNNFEIINHTTNVTNINVNHGAHTNFRGVTVGGPPINELNAHSRQRIQTVQLTQASQPGKSTLQGNKLSVFAPRVNPDSVHQARPGSVAQTLNHPTFNRGDSISKPLDVTRTIHATPPTPEAIHAAEQAQAAVPATAKIATSSTPIRTAPSQPFTSLAPVVHHNPGNTSNPGAQGFNNGNGNFHPEHHSDNGGGPANTPGNQPQEPRVFKQQERAPTETINPAPNTASPATFHHEKQDNGGNGQPGEFTPSHTPPVHTESPNNNGGFHTQSQNTGGNNGGQGQGGNHSSSGGQSQGGGNNHPSGGGQNQGGGNHPSGGDQGGDSHPSGGGGKNDKKP